MDILPTDLPTDIVYVCIEFLDWKEYYKLCKHIHIDFRFNVYFRNNNQKLSIDDVCYEKEEYLEVVKFLHSINAPYTQYAMNLASGNGHLKVVKFLHSINAPYTHFAMDSASLNGQLEVVNFLHSINASYTHLSMNWASRNGHLEVVKFLHSINAPYTQDAMHWASLKG